MRLERIYDRSELIGLTTEKVLTKSELGICPHLRGSVAVPGQLRSAIVVSATIPWRCSSRHKLDGAARRVRQSALGRRDRFRPHRRRDRHTGREHLPALRVGRGRSATRRPLRGHAGARRTSPGKLAAIANAIGRSIAPFFSALIISPASCRCSRFPASRGTSSDRWPRPTR